MARGRSFRKFSILALTLTLTEVKGRYECFCYYLGFQETKENLVSAIRYLEHIRIFGANPNDCMKGQGHCHNASYGPAVYDNPIGIRSCCSLQFEVILYHKIELART